MSAPVVVDLNQFQPRVEHQCVLCETRIPEPPLGVTQREQRDAALTGSLNGWISSITTAALTRQAQFMNAAVALHLQQHTTESEG
ncbi:MAG TPA: hypothetical protein VHX38_18690 [Pseudonocardiaceae bacterium]|jgi:hypothetical protein|nr:hypothetical protein [Pseudonocardiaceae bacterium]